MSDTNRSQSVKDVVWSWDRTKEIAPTVVQYNAAIVWNDIASSSMSAVNRKQVNALIQAYQNSLPKHYIAEAPSNRSLLINDLRSLILEYREKPSSLLDELERFLDVNGLST